MSGLSSFTIHDKAFEALLGPDPKLDLLLEHDQYPFAHEAGVFVPSTNELFITSNRFQDDSGADKIQISKISLDDKSERQTLTDPSVLTSCYDQAPSSRSVSHVLVKYQISNRTDFPSGGWLMASQEFMTIAIRYCTVWSDNADCLVVMVAAWDPSMPKLKWQVPACVAVWFRQWRGTPLL